MVTTILISAGGCVFGWYVAEALRVIAARRAGKVHRVRHLWTF